MNDNVIIASSWKSDHRRYHTTDCRQVWKIKSKQYLSKGHAEKMGLDECKYCSGEYETSNGDRSIYEAAKAYNDD